MKKKIILLLSVCVLFTGCSSELFTALSNGSSFFYRFSGRGENDVYLAEGTACQMSGDKNLTLVELTAEKDSTIAVTGKQKSVKGDIQLVYTASDGTETLIADIDDTDIDAVVSVQKGEGKIGFIPVHSSGGAEKEAVYNFDFRLKAGEGVTFKGHTVEETVPVEKSEKPLKEIEPPEAEELRGELESLEPLEEPEEAFPGIEDKWPQSIAVRVDGLYAQPLMLDFDMEGAGAVSVSYTAGKGELSLKIVNESGEVYFERTDIQAGDEEESVVDIDEEGTYWIYLYAEYYGGEIVIKPER